MRNLKLQFTKIITGFLLLIFGSLNSMSAQNWDWDWNGDTLDLGLPCDSLIQFECNGETIELSACDIDWVVLQDCFFNNDYDDWDGYEDSIDYENYYDWDWDWFGDTLDLGLPCDSLIQFECNGETIELSACDIDWVVLQDCFFNNDYDDWDGYEDSIDYENYYDWDWDWFGDTLDLGLPCDSLIQFECNGETIELSACDIDWVVLQDCFFNNDYDDWDWFGDTLDLGLPCDSLIQFECNGETIEFSACDIDWEVLEDCTAAALEDGLPQQDMFDNDEPQQFETKSNGGDANNPIVNEVYPNPVVNNLYIDVTTYEPGSIEFIVIDAKGSLVHQEQMELSGGGKYVLPINFETKLRKGMYILNIVNESNQIIKTQSLIVAE